MKTRRRVMLSVWLAFELLLAIAGPALAHAPIPSSDPPARHAPTGAPFACDTLWKGGIPRSGTGLTSCLEHANERIGGADYRVVYPAEWAAEATGGWGVAFLDPAAQAMRRAVNVYGALGLMGSVTIVFSRLERTPGDDPRADADLVEALSD